MASRLEGGKELDLVLRRLPRAVQRRALVKGLRAAGKDILGPAKANVPRDQGELFRALGIAVDRAQRAQAAIAIGARKKRGGAHAHLVEFGTVERVDPNTGKSSGVMPPQPFMRPAFEAHKFRALETFRTELAAAMAREAEKLARGTGRRR